MNIEQLRELNADCREVFKKDVQHFFCPILLTDENVELCDGHVLCDKIKGASKAKVVQRKDIDNYYGTQVEPDLIMFLNLAVDSPAELMNRPKMKLSIKMPDGSITEAFFANPEAGKKFQQVSLTDKNGNPIAFPFLRDARLEENVKDMEISWTIFIRNSAVIASLVKSGYLALFRLLKYRWVDSIGGDKVRRVLKAFYDARGEGKQTSKVTTKTFADFDGCVTVMFGSAADWPDTLEGNTLLLHHTEWHGNLLLFAISCLFKVNTQMLIVTLPSTSNDRECFTAFSFYRNYLKNRSMKQTVYYAIFEDGKFKMDNRAVNLTYTPEGAD